MIRRGFSEMDAALKGSSFSRDELFLAYVESRLRGIRRRWNDFAEQAAGASDEELRAGFHGQFLKLLGAITGKRGIGDDVLQTAAALYERENWPSLREFLSVTFADAANGVATAMEPAWFDAVAGAILDDPKVRQAHQIYKRDIEGPMAANHELNEGVFSDALGELGTYYPLIAAAKPTARAGPGKRLPYRKPANIANRFATGLAEAYTTDAEAFRDRLTSAVRANNKAALLEALRDSGWRPQPPCLRNFAG